MMTHIVVNKIRNSKKNKDQQKSIWNKFHCVHHLYFLAAKFYYLPDSNFENLFSSAQEFTMFIRKDTMIN